MRFEELYERRQQRILTMAEAGEMLGVEQRKQRPLTGPEPLAGDGRPGGHQEGGKQDHGGAWPGSEVESFSSVHEQRAKRCLI